MRILLDECLPRKLKGQFVGHPCSTVPEASLAGKKNGELLSLAEGQGFEIFITVDQGLAYQQNLSGRKISIIVLRARSNRLIDLLPLVGKCLSHLREMKPSQVVLVGD
jgi:predicted nuclease of predicted toxin-antitoxin system